MTLHPTNQQQTSDSSATAASSTSLPRVALVGVQGYGSQHLENLRRLQRQGRVELLAAADPHAPRHLDFPAPVSIFNSLEELLAATPSLDIVIIATPIQTHAPLAFAAMEAGADVYLEKPPVASLEQYEQLLQAAERTNSAVQIGFQSLGSHALPAIAQLIESGRIGQLRSVSATGQWVRSRAYYQRSSWAGKRRLQGTDVVDGVATNPLAHAVATALHIAGARSSTEVTGVDTDLYHAHDIESDDTSVVRIRTVNGPTVTCALTLCAAESEEPYITISGSEGQAVFHYTSDTLEVTTAAGQESRTFGRSNLLDNLLEHRAGGAPLLIPLEHGGAFMRVLEEIRTAPQPEPVDPAYVRWEGEADDAHPVIAGLADLIHRATEAESTFAELGADWARQLPAEATIRLAGHTVAGYQSGDLIRNSSSPRPYLHPISTLTGTVVSDHMPLDHVWHLGAGVAIQDVNDINFWGGRSYRREAGRYIWRPDHGHIRRAGELEQEPGRMSENLEWVGPDGVPVMSEQRNWTFNPVDDHAWQLSLDFTLVPAIQGPVKLGSPGSHGRDQGGYGGFFWRLPSCTAVNVRTARASGEESVHGAVAPWLAWTADFGGHTATLVFLAGGEASDPWFVRVSDYPGVGLSLAWDTAVETTRQHPLTRSVSVLVADGSFTDPELEALIQKAAGPR